MPKNIKKKYIQKDNVYLGNAFANEQLKMKKFAQMFVALKQFMVENIKIYDTDSFTKPCIHSNFDIFVWKMQTL